jgi:glycosyltransferase involved in cell wall biosynthesis
MSRRWALDRLPAHSVMIDGRPLQNASSVRGIGSYLRGLLDGLAELDHSDLVSVLLSKGPPPDELAPLHWTRRRIARVHPTLQPSLDLLFITSAVFRERPRLFHGVEWGQPVGTRTPVVMTVHDLIPFLFPRHYPWVRRARLLPLHLLRRSSRVIAVSEATSLDVQRIAHVEPDRITVIPEGIARAFRPADAESTARARERYGLGHRPYVLAVGTFEPRKRIRVLADVTSLLRRTVDVDLVIAGDQGTFDVAVRRTLRDAGIEGGVHLTGHVPLHDLAALYSAAECLVFTSAYEGFGLPPLEAMACGTPVVMFRNSSLPEIAGPSVMVRDGDAAAMAAAASELIARSAARAARVSAGLAWVADFTWRRTAQRTLEVYEQVLGSTASR